MLKPKSYDVRGKRIIIDDRFELGYFGLQCLMCHQPESVVITRLEAPVAVLIDKNKRRSWGTKTYFEAMPCPVSLLDAWEYTGRGTMEPFAEMVAESFIPLSFDLGPTVGTALLLPVGARSEIDLKRAVHLNNKESLQIRYHLGRPFFEHMFGLDLSLEDFRSRYDISGFGM